MTSHPDPEPTGPAPDRDDSPVDSPEQQSVPAVESDAVESDAYATIAVPPATGPSEDEPTVVDESGTVHPASATDSDPEMTLAKKLEGVLEDFAQTLAPEHQDLDRTLSTTSLKAAVDSESDQRSRHESFSQSRSVRPRSIQPADSTIVDAGSTPSADTESPDRDLDYVTLNKLGEGGMGTVHLARQVALGREVALKQIHQRSSRKQSMRDELLTEAVLTGKLEHPNIVPIYEVGESAGGDLFYSMKNVKGHEWEETIDDLLLRENLKILIDVCDAIAFAHAEGVIHRDLKPQNIMTGGFGEVLVLDWGLAVLAHPGEDVTTSAGGTPGCMAPEMINPPFLVGPRSDVYLLGAILFRFLTGQAPHAGKSARDSLTSASRNEIVDPDAERMQSLDPTGELLGVALQAMATEPADRYQTVGEFQAAIREYLAHEESIELAARAADHLEDARQSKGYDEFSRARFGFETALEQWPGNVRAAEGLNETRRDYARTACDRGDFDLALTLLDAADPDHVALITSIQDFATERDSRMDRIRRLRRFGLAATLTIGVLALLTGAAGALGLHRVANRLKGAIDHGLKIERLANQVEVSLLQARRREKDFLLRWRSEGVEQARSTYVTANAASIAELFKLTSELDKEIQEHPPSEAGHFVQELTDLRGMIETYRDEFGQLVELIQTMGVKDTGGVGQFRTAVHKLEAKIQNSEDLVASQTTLLQLRRHEKDYLLRGDNTYIEHTQETAAQLRREIETALPEDESRLAILELLDAYLTGLYKVARISGDIDERTSLFRGAAHKIESSSHKFAATGLVEGRRQIAEAEAVCANAYATVTALVVVALVLGLGFAYVLGRNLTIPIRLLSGTRARCVL